MVRKFHLISADKKLTHDLMDLAGYTHIVPGQAGCVNICLYFAIWAASKQGA